MSTLDQFVNPVVIDEEGRKLTLTMRRTDKLKVLMDFYHEMVPAASGIFLSHGSRIMGWKTPEEYGMMDGDIIEFWPDITPDRLVTPVLQDFTGRSFTRTMLKTDRMQGLMDFYTDVVPSDAVASDGDDGGGIFMYRGEPVLGEHTPADLGVKDCDVIYFVPLRRSKGTVKSDVYITVKVQDSGLTFCRTMRLTEKLEVLMDLYWKFRLDGCLFFNGRRLRGDETPAKLKMKDGDVVDFFLTQYGGMAE